MYFSLLTHINPLVFKCVERIEKTHVTKTDYRSQDRKKACYHSLSEKENASDYLTDFTSTVIAQLAKQRTDNAYCELSPTSPQLAYTSS